VAVEGLSAVTEPACDALDGACAVFFSVGLELDDDRAGPMPRRNVGATSFAQEVAQPFRCVPEVRAPTGGSRGHNAMMHDFGARVIDAAARLLPAGGRVKEAAAVSADPDVLVVERKARVELDGGEIRHRDGLLELRADVAPGLAAVGA